MEVSSVDKAYNVYYELVLVKDGVDDDGHHGRKEVAAENFTHDDYETAGLEDSTV